MYSDRPVWGTRWSVVLGGFMLALMGGLSYSWGVFVKPLGDILGWSKSSAMVPLSVFMMVFALVMIPAGRLQERFNTRRLIVTGACLFLLSNLLSSFVLVFASRIWLVFTYGIIGGIACGLTYSCVAPAIRWWFPDFPGLAVSLGVMGFGLASFFFAPFKANYSIPVLGLDGTFLLIAALTFIVTMLASRLVVFPTEQSYIHLFGAMHLPDKTGMIRANIKPKQMVKRSLFWMVWSSFLFIIYGSLLIIGILPAYGQEVALLSGSKAAIPISLFALFNGLSRPIVGFTSDKIGIPKVMMIVYAAQAIVFFLFPYYITDLLSMNIAAIILGFGIGSALALYPVLTSELFGVVHLGMNYGIVFTAYGFGAIAIQAGAYVRDLTGSYELPLLIAGVLSVISAVLVFMIQQKYKV